MKSFRNSNKNKVIDPEQLNQIVDSILDGKYSWACVLLLRFVGYDPVRYIPNRTYTRLMKENSLANKKKIAQSAVSSKYQGTQLAANTENSRLAQHQIADLSYFETAKDSVSISGGYERLMRGDCRISPTLDLEHFWRSDWLVSSWSDSA